MRQLRTFKSIAAMVLLGVIMSYMLVKTLHLREVVCSYTVEEGLSTEDDSYSSICTYLLSPFVRETPELIIFESWSVAFLLFPSVREKEDVLQLILSLRAPPAL